MEPFQEIAIDLRQLVKKHRDEYVEIITAHNEIITNQAAEIKTLSAKIRRLKRQLDDRSGHITNNQKNKKGEGLLFGSEKKGLRAVGGAR